MKGNRKTRHLHSHELSEVSFGERQGRMVSGSVIPVEEADSESSLKKLTMTQRATMSDSGSKLGVEEIWAEG